MWRDAVVGFVDQAVKDFNESEKIKMHLSWSPSRDDADVGEKEQTPEGEIKWCGQRFGIFISHSGDSESPDSFFVRMSFEQFGMDEDEDFPLFPVGNPRDIYNAMQEAGYCRFILMPEVSDSPKLRVLGLDIEVPVEALTGRLISAKLSELRQTTGLVYEWLRYRDGFDHWEEFTTATDGDDPEET